MSFMKKLYSKILLLLLLSINKVNPAFAMIMIWENIPLNARYSSLSIFQKLSIYIIYFTLFPLVVTSFVFLGVFILNPRSQIPINI